MLLVYVPVANHSFVMINVGLRASVAQIQVVEKLELTLNDDLEFFKLFKNGIANIQLDKEDEYRPSN